MSSTRPEPLFALVDCNNFYASCERVFKPQLEGKPVVVLSNNDGCIISRSNEAKALGIKMGQPAFLMEEFLQKNNVAVCSSNYALYGDLSERVMKTLAEFTPDIEIYSIDEAFLNLGNKAERAIDLAAQIRSTVRQWTGIPICSGIAATKTLAKAANRIAKKTRNGPGVCMLTGERNICKVLSDFPVEDIWGIGPSYSDLLKKHGICTALDLRNADDPWIQKHLTIVGLRLVHELRGISCIPLEAVPPPKKAICTARSFGKMTSDFNQLSEAVATYTSRCAEKLRAQKGLANLLTVFVETNRFREDLPQYTNCKVMHLSVASNSTMELVHSAVSGLKTIYKKEYLYKKAGVIVEAIVPEGQEQTSLFDTVDREKQHSVMAAMDAINKSVGRDAVRVGAQGFKRKWKLRQERLSPRYTTKWEDLLTITV